jgi:TetR/AcrR family transcriptional regulator, cholesterol catabolism regulator
MTLPGGDRVLIAAADQFAESGFAAATVRQIAERCGMSTGSLFNRFASKRELLVAAVAEGTIRPDAHVRARLDGITDPLERLRILVVAHLESLHGESKPFVTVALREFHRLDEAERQRVVRIRDEFEQLWQTVLDDAVAANLVSDDPLLRLFLLGAVNHTLTWYRPGAGLTLDELGSRFVTLAVHGLGASAWSGQRSDFRLMEGGL